MLWLAGCGQQGPEVPYENVTVLELSLPDATKTTVSESLNGKRKVYWSDGDAISLNGVESSPLKDIGEKQNSASFTVQGSFSLPYNVLYPASYYTDEQTVTLPAKQEYSSGAVIVPMACRVTSEADAELKHLCTVLRLAVVGTGKLASVTFRGNAGEQVCGDFSIDYQTGKLSPSSTDSDNLTVGINVQQDMSQQTPLELFLAFPAGNYASGFTVTLTAADGKAMLLKHSSSTNCVAGHIFVPAVVTFSNTEASFSFELGELQEDVLVMDNYNVTGRVVDTVGNPIEGVVVTDGDICVKTGADGAFYMLSELEASDFIYISTPAGYLPEVKGGIPVFYKKISSLSNSGGVLQCGDFVLTPVANPDNCTLFFTADPQPRATKWSMDNIAYRSLVCCNDLYRELKETAAGISGRQVYGICLGDVVHEDMSLYANYAEGLSTLGYPTYNIIGNHDNNYDAASDEAAGAVYESYFGPRNYSFNIGKMHFVMLDNLIQGGVNGNKTLDQYDQGLTDTIWEWLQNDMAMVPTTTKIMVCAHSPMFRQQSGSERTNTANHGGHTDPSGEYGYGDLFDKYGEVHAWAGHTHATFNYIYSSTHRHKNIQVHTLARSTGELWTNEYLSGGTPRGFTIVEIRNGVIESWRFHPTKYQTGAFHGATKPTFKYRDWDYDSNGVAVMKSNGKTLDESYQMHVYPPGSYKGEEGYLYVNVFLWDSKWETPEFTSGGSSKEMTLVTAEDRYDCGEIEMSSFYKANASVLKNYSGYPAITTNYPNTLFRVPASASGSGTVSVVDRFGNEYRQSITW